MTELGTPRTITAERVYLGDRFEKGVVLAVDHSGMISAVESGSEAELRLDGQVVIPGFVNAHSHAFQRALRGRTTTTLGSEREEHFWTWRDEMYRLVLDLTPDDVRTHSLQAFREMAAAGFTSVGEFHYLHHDRDGRPYEDRNLLAQRVIAAALESGLRITLLNVFYERGGIRDEPLAAGQVRFGGEPVEEFLDRTRVLAHTFVGDNRVGIGVAPHSVRAVSPGALKRIVAAAIAEGWPCHIHLSEQESEVEECLEVYGQRPVELVAELDGLGSQTTGVHCTHITDAEIRLLADSGASVCACPTTEADLGDGFLRALELRAAGVPIGLGTDSQARIDPFEEMRAVEYHERLRHRRRNVLGSSAKAGSDGSAEVAGELLTMATRSGAGCLGLAVGELAPGKWADFVCLDLAHPILGGWTDGSLGALLALGADPRIITGTYVGGRRIA